MAKPDTVTPNNYLAITIQHCGRQMMSEGVLNDSVTVAQYTRPSKYSQFDSSQGKKIIPAASAAAAAVGRRNH